MKLSERITPGHWLKDQTRTGKYKVTDINGFAIVSAPDGTSISAANVTLIAEAKEMLSILERLTSDCMASDFNEHWDSYKDAIQLLNKLNS